MPRAPAKKIVNEAIAELDGVRRQWLRRKGVNAVDVGFKIKDNELTDEVALRVHVGRKMPAAELAGSEVFNETGKKTKKVGKFPVDVIEASYGPSATAAVESPLALDDTDEDAIAALERTGIFDPMIGGISCGNPRVTAGTLGAIVFDRKTCKPMILSNWHVLAGASAAAVGEDILQPGRIDGGTDVVANLTRMKLDSRMDAAVATLDGSRNHSRDILGLGVISGSDTATLGMNVIKSGRTTGITKGVVDGVSLSVSINYGDPGVVAFSNQIRIVPRPPWPSVNYEVSMGGDSGSVWLRESNNRAIGLHFAGETDPAPASENAIANPIGPVVSELNFSFTPVLCPYKPRPPIIDICRRYPWICRGLIRWPYYPGPRPGPFTNPTRGGFRTFRQSALDAQKGSGHDCGCGCGGGENQEAQEMMMQLLAALMEEESDY